MSLSLEPLLALWGLPHGAQVLPALSAVSTDSRGDLGGALFVPLVGERFDGHAFLETALQAGAAAAVAQNDRRSAAELQALAERFGVPIWSVPDTQLAYQQLARA